MRAPNFLLTIVAMYLLYKGVAKVFGRRAGLLGALVLATMPDWFFLAHQTMTDMPFVAAMTAAMGLLLLGLHTDEDATRRVYEVEAFGATSCRLSALAPRLRRRPRSARSRRSSICSRATSSSSLHGDGPQGFRLHWDEFRSGSARQLRPARQRGVHVHAPGQHPEVASARPRRLRPSMLRFFGALRAGAAGARCGRRSSASLLYLNWGERRVRRLFYIARLVLRGDRDDGQRAPPASVCRCICAFAYVATKKPLERAAPPRDPERPPRHPRGGAALVRGDVRAPRLAVHRPADLPRHVQPRVPHVHDTNEGDDTSFRFYIWQLGYALFPWTGLVPPRASS